VRAFALRGVWVAIVIGMAFIGMTILLTRAMIQSHAPSYVYLFPALFVLVGLYSLFGHSVVAKVEAEHTFYGVTNKRILISYSHFFWKRLVEIPLKGRSEFPLWAEASRVGTIYFLPPRDYGPFGWMVGWADIAGLPTPDNDWKYVSVAFQCIENPNDVVRIIKSAVKEV
jgi:hypothetical protein